MLYTLHRITLLAALFFTSGMAQAINIDLVPVGNPGNVGDQSRLIYGDTKYYGAVDYNYHISRCEISAGQYVEFLNAVAKMSDPYGLYNPNMTYTSVGSKIIRNVNSGKFTYSAISPNQPINYVSWGDAARFCNWLNNGQPTTGAEDLSTTEDGAYFLNGKTYYDLMEVTRNANAIWVVPTLDEWYKAA
jgi:formylglycine-generating enzyme